MSEFSVFNRFIASYLPFTGRTNVHRYNLPIRYRLALMAFVLFFTDGWSVAAQTGSADRLNDLSSSGIYLDFEDPRAMGSDNASTEARVDPSFGAGQVDRVVQYVLGRHPDLLQQQAEINRQLGLRHQSTRSPNPVVGYLASEVGNEGRAGQQGAFLSWERVRGGKLEIACQVGTWRVAAAQAELDAATLRIEQRVRRQYWSVVAGRYRVQLWSQLEGSLQQAIEINQKLVDAGEGTRGSLLQAKLELSQVAIAKKQAEIELRARTVTLAATLGAEPDWIEALDNDAWPDASVKDWLNPFQISSNISNVADPNRSEWESFSADFDTISLEPWQRVMQSPELTRLQAEIEAARWEVLAAQAEVIGNMQTMASVQHDFVTSDVIVGLQMGAAVPLRDRKTGLIRAAESAASRRLAELQSARRELEVRWLRAVQDYQSAREMTAAIDGELLGLVEQRLTLASQAYQEGEIDYLDLLTAQRSYIAIQQTALDAYEQAALAWSTLQTLAIEDR